MYFIHGFLLMTKTAMVGKGLNINFLNQVGGC